MKGFISESGCIINYIIFFIVSLFHSLVFRFIQYLLLFVSSSLQLKTRDSHLLTTNEIIREKKQTNKETDQIQHGDFIISY